MRYVAHEKQAKFHLSEARIRAAFAGKRCINPQSKVLTTDGVKEFADISFGDKVLSWNQKANQFQFRHASASFPKAKDSGYRVIHERGEFVASSKHLVFLNHYGYQSVSDIKNLLDQDSNEINLSFVSHDQTIEELYQKSCLLNGQSFFDKLLNCQDHYESYSNQYDQQLHPLKAIYQALFQPLFGVLKSHRQFYLSLIEHLDVLFHKRLIHTHLYQSSFHHSNLGDLDLSSYLSDFLFEHRLNEHTSSLFHHLSQVLKLPFRNSCASGTMKEFDLLSFDQVVSSACESRILVIEKVSSQWWWDVQIEGNNNYLSEGAIHHNSGKTECGAIEAIKYCEVKKGYNENSIDHYAGAIIAPTLDMLKRLSFEKFFAYSKPFKFEYNKSHYEITWHNGAKIYGISADKPERLEGLKLSWIWIDEVFQVKEQIFLESLARLSDTQGDLWITGSLGVQYMSPKNHFCYKYFKEKPLPDAEIFEWSTAENPYFPQEELIRLKDALDPRTYRQMFTIDWNVSAKNIVFDNIDDGNFTTNYQFDPRLETLIGIDWGYATQMAAVFIQYNPYTDTVFVFDEIVGSRMMLDTLYEKIMQKGYPIKEWYCDIAGTQTREYSGRSNVDWFRQKGIYFKYASKPVNFGIELMRQYILDGKGRRKLVIDERRCPVLADQIKNYHYAERDGKIISENPVKENDHTIDALRYPLAIYLANKKIGKTIVEFNRFGNWKIK